MEPIEDRPVGLSDADLARLEAAAEAMGEAAAQLYDALQRFAEAVREFVAAALTHIYNALDRWLETWRRLYLAAQIRRWRIPERAALWIAERWPRRWLPALPAP